MWCGERAPASADVIDTLSALNFTTIESAIAAVKKGDLNACREALLALWQKNRPAAYASTIDRETALHDEGHTCSGRARRTPIS